MEEALRRALGTAVLRPTRHSGGGCLSQGRSYDTDCGRVFVKRNSLEEPTKIFLGEVASLEAIRKTQTVRVPKPIKIVEVHRKNAVLVMEHFEMKSLNRHSALLGAQLADLHLHNLQLREKIQKEGSTVGKGQGQMEILFVDHFGFHTFTFCGYLPQINSWQRDWLSFFVRQRILPQLHWVETNSGDREAIELWAQLQLKIDNFFYGVEIVPALLHGDLWGGNVAEDDAGPIVFDPASFYGHSEYDLATAGMFGGFSSSFYSAYHSKIPKAAGFEKRVKLYQLYHYMNHWNHFGSGYRGPTLNIMKTLLM